MTFTGLTAARKRLEDLATKLRSAASGEVVARAAAKVGALIDKVAREKVARHVATGHAASALTVPRAGGLITVEFPRYLDFHSWWPFRRGMPGFIVKAAALVLARELLAVLGRAGAGLDVAAMVEAADASEAAAAEKKLAAADRRLDNRIKRQEARDERRGQREHKQEQARAKRQEARAIEKSRAKFKADNARIYRQSAEGKAARASARKAAKK